MIKSAVLTRASDNKTVILQVQTEDGVIYKRMSRKELLNLVNTGINFLYEDEEQRG